MQKNTPTSMTENFQGVASIICHSAGKYTFAQKLNKSCLLWATGMDKWIHHNLFHRETSYVYLNTSSVLQKRRKKKLT